MAFWDGTVSTDFLSAGNWSTGIVPNATEFVTLDNLGAGLNLDPTLFSGDFASILNLEMFARTFTVDGNLTVDTHARIFGPGILNITPDGTVTVGGSGLTVNGGALNNFGTLNSTVEITGGGVVTNGGVINGAVTVLDGTLQVQNDITAAGAITLNGSGVGDGGALRNLSGSNVVEGAITLAGATRINSDAGQLEINGDITGTNTNLTVGGTGTTLIAGDILTGTGSLTVDATEGTGIVQLQGANTFAGGTTVSSGFLNLLGGSALADGGALTVNSPGTVQVFDGETVSALSGDGVIALRTTGALVAGAGTNTTFSGQIIEFGAVGAFTKAGAGTLILSGNNTYTGTTTISEGTLQIGAGGTTGSLGTGAVVNNGALVFDRSGFNTVGNAISGTGTLTVTGGDSLILTGTNTYSGTTTIDTGGSLKVSSGGTTGTLGTGAVTNNGFLTFARSDNPTVANVISGSGGVGKDGGGTLILSGASTYSGETTISEGTLDITGSIASLSVNVNNSASLRVDGSAISNTATVTLNGSGNLTLNGNERIGALASASATTTVTLLGNRILTTGDEGDDTFAGVISGTGRLIKQGTGTFTLTGANDYTGLTTVSQGTLAISNATALGTTAARTTVANGATLAVQGGIIVAEAITLKGTGVGNGGALRNVSGFNEIDGSITLTGATRINSDAGQVDITGGITGAFGLTVGGAGTTAIASNIATGAGTLTKDGTGILALSVANDFTGATTVNAGALQVQATGALSATGLLTVNAPGFVQLYANETVGNISGNGGIFMEAAGLTLTAGDATNQTFSGEIGQDGANAANFTKAGTGTLTLSGANSYTGTTTISEGTLQIGAGGTTGSLGTGAVINNGALVFDRAGFNTVGNAISGTGTLTVTGEDALILTGTNSYSGTTTINAGGALQVGSFGTTGTLGTGAVTNNGQLNFARSDDLTVANVISGSGSVTKFGGGTLILSGASTYTGQTSVINGLLDITGSLASQSVVAFNTATLRVDGSAISNAATVTLEDSSNLTLTGNERIGALSSGFATTTVTLGNRILTTGDAGNDTFAGVISGTGRLTKVGTGTFTLTGANDYTGLTTVSQGTLDITGSIASQSVTVNGGTLRVDGAAISDTATVTLNGSGNLTLTGNEQIGALASASATTTVTLGANTLTTGDLGGAVFAGVISGTGGLTIANGDGGGFFLTGANTYAGVTTINAGVNFSVGSGGTTGTLGTGAVVNNGVLEFSRSNDFTVANAISGTGVLSMFNAGIMELSGVSTTTGRLAVSGSGTLNITGSVASQIVEVNSGILRVDGGSLSDAATVTLRNSGNLTLAGSETIGNLVADSATASVNLGGNHLTLAAQTGGLGAMSFNGSAGIDRLSITLAPTLANFSLVGVNFASWTEGTDIVTVTGNALANRLTGNAGNNRLDGGIGADTLLGGAGNDTYIVDSTGDRVFETTTTTSGINAGGVDTVRSSVNFNLDASAGVRFVERLTLTGTGNINGTGNALANLLTGNAGNNVLNGGLGNDTMIGGAGNDTFVFNTALAATNVDRLSDFSVVDDTIRLDDAVFSGLTTGSLAASAFAANLTGEAADGLNRIIYETDTGRLYFDADGSGSSVRVQFATLAANLALTDADFFVF